MTVRVYQKEIPIGDRAIDEIIEEMQIALSTGAELNHENRNSHIVIQIEAEDDESAVLHKLWSEGFTPLEPIDAEKST